METIELVLILVVHCSVAPCLFLRCAGHVCILLGCCANKTNLSAVDVCVSVSVVEKELLSVKLMKRITRISR